MKHQDMRRRIAHAAARLLAEDGSQDYGSAKRKAARQLGAPDSRNLPDNQEIEDALRSYQAIYQAGERDDRVARLRSLALEYMEALHDFDPHLAGSVLNGTASRYSDVNLQLFTDQHKDVEFRLMRLPHRYQAGEQRDETGTQVLPRYRVDDPRATIDIVVYPANALRHLRRQRADGSPLRVRIEPLRALIDAA
jgi:hypothetical protein